MNKLLFLYCDVFVVGPLDSARTIREMEKLMFSSTVKAVKLYIGKDKVRNRMPIFFGVGPGQQARSQRYFGVRSVAHGAENDWPPYKRGCSEARSLSTLGKAPCIRVGTVLLSA